LKKRIVDFIFELKSSCSAKELSIRKNLNLSPAEYRGILSLSPKTAIPCSMLAKKMGLSVSRGSRVVDKLMKNGYLKEEKAIGDRRVLKVMLAPKGIKIREKISKMLDECERTILKKMSKQELESIVTSFIKINGILISK
jgi:DNA-binding MarR family transcriptional regulator